MATALWKRIDLPGHDAAVLTEAGSDLHLEGVAMFRDADAPVTLSYEVCQHCDGTLWAHIEGQQHGERFAYDIRRISSGWLLNGAPMGLRHLHHLTLGFTPATVTLLMRGRTLGIRRSLGIRAVHFDIDQPGLTEWPHQFRRRDRDLYDYRTPDRATLLQIEGDGFIRSDPGLWHREA